MEIVRIGPADWKTFRTVRLAALAESPGAFGSRYDDWADASPERWQSRLTQVPLTLLARDADSVVGMVCGMPVDEDWVELVGRPRAATERRRGTAVPPGTDRASTPGRRSPR